MVFNVGVSGYVLDDKNKIGIAYANESSRQEHHAKDAYAFHDLPIAQCENRDPICHQAVTPSIQMGYLHIVEVSLETSSLHTRSADHTYQTNFVVRSVLQRLRSVQVLYPFHSEMQKLKSLMIATDAESLCASEDKGISSFISSITIASSSGRVISRSRTTFLHGQTALRTIF